MTTLRRHLGASGDYTTSEEWPSKTASRVATTAPAAGTSPEEKTGRGAALKDY